MSQKAYIELKKSTSINILPIHKKDCMIPLISYDIILLITLFFSLSRNEAFASNLDSAFINFPQRLIHYFTS